MRVLLNMAAGTAAKATCADISKELVVAFAEHGICAAVQPLAPADLKPAIERACQEASRGELDAVVAGGGDGTIRAHAGILAGSGVGLGVIPLGTRNNFARDMDIPLNTREAVELIAGGFSTAVDVADVNGHIFVNNSSIGVYPYLVLERERRRRRHRLSKWTAMLLAAVFAARNFPVRRLRITAADRVELHRSPCLFVGNNEYRLTGFDFGSRPTLSAGRLCVYIARQESAFSLLLLALRCILGRLDPRRDLRVMTLSELVISSQNRKLLVALDGEVESIRSPLCYRTRPGSLRVYSRPSA